MFYDSELIIKFTIGSVDRSDHISEVVHADISTRGISKQAVVELLLKWLGVIWGISYALTILLFSVASPHSIDWFFASQEVV